MNTRLQLQKSAAVTAGAVMIWALAVSQSSVAAASPVTIGTVQGVFFANPTDSGAFDSTVLSGSPALTQQFPVIGFNPPASAMKCSNATGVDIFSRPMGDVVPNPDGSCSVIPVAGNSLQAGLGLLSSFQAVFTADLNVSSAGQVTFNVFSDDGFVLAIGPQGNNQPKPIPGGPMANPPASSFVKGYAVMGALNQKSLSATTANDIVIDFPAGGTYPLELDYTECCGGTLSLVLALSGTILPPSPPPPPSTHATAVTYTGDSSADFNDPAHLSATLQDTSVSRALANEPVTLAIGAQSCIGTTDSTGVAACNLKPNVAAGNYAVSATFAGDATFQASSASAPFVVTLEEASLTYTGASNLANGNSTTMSGNLPEDGTTPITGRSIVFTLGSGATAQSCTGITNSVGTGACTMGIAQPLGPGNIAANFASDGFYRSASAGASALVYENLSSGAFVIADKSASLGASVTFWGAQWANTNSLSGGPAPDSFKGFGETLSVTPATCSATWSTDTGNSSGPPATVPSYVAILVTSSVSQAGSVVSGTVSEIVVVSTNPGYLNDPGDPGTGTVVAILCHS
jgi:hypothetical protein